MLIFSFFDILNTDLRLTHIVDPVPPLIYQSTSHKTSTHQLITLRLSALKISGMYILVHMYLSNCHNLRQSSLYGSCTPIFSKATAIWVYFLPIGIANRSCAKLWWNAVACYLSKIFISLLGRTPKKIYPVGVESVFMIHYGKSAIPLIT